MKEIIAPISGRVKQSLIYYPKWERIVNKYKHTPTLGTHIVENNRKINLAYEYIPEDIDFWSTPDEFEYNGGGDCEDFAIFKFYTFALPRYIAVGTLKENNSGHAVLTVYSGEHKDWVVLDSMTDRILTWQEYLKNFTPMYLCDLEGIYI